MFHVKRSVVGESCLQRRFVSLRSLNDRSLSEALRMRGHAAVEISGATGTKGAVRATHAIPTPW
jgi:hypothetical protein